MGEEKRAAVEVAETRLANVLSGVKGSGSFAVMRAVANLIDAKIAFAISEAKKP